MAEKQNLQRVEIIANLFGKTARRIMQLTQDGVLPIVQTDEGRRYDLLPTIQRYIKYLEQRAERNSDITQEKLNQKLDAEIKFKKAKADKMKIELDELKGIMHRSEDVEKITNDLVYAVRAMLLALPGRVAMDLAGINTAPEVSEYMAKHVASLLDELSLYTYDEEKYAQLVREREGMQEKAESDEDEDDDDEKDQ